MSALDRVDWNDPFSYIREMYGVPAAKGARITYCGDPGTIISAEHQYLWVDLDRRDDPLMIHPTWEVEYL
jgi:hypothetical protein